MQNIYCILMYNLLLLIQSLQVDMSFAQVI